MPSPKLSGYAQVLLEALQQARWCKYFPLPDDSSGKPALRADDDSNESKSLSVLLGYTGKRPSREELRASLIKLCYHDYFTDTESEMLLFAFGLLHGYEEDNPGKRKDLCLEHSNYFKRTDPKNYTIYNDSSFSVKDRSDAFHLAKNALEKYEAGLVEQLALLVERMPDRVTYIMDNKKYLSDDTPPKALIQAPRPTSKLYIPEDAPVISGDQVPFISAKIDYADETQCNNSSSYVITQNAPRWKNENIRGRHDFLADLCDDLLGGIQHIQLTGMGGIGKSEVLNQIYVHFADNQTKHHFEHVGFLYYDGAEDIGLEKQLVCSASSGSDGSKEAWDYLKSIGENSSLLLLIDDIRPQQEKKADKSASNAFFLNLLSLRATIVLASRAPINGFKAKPVDALSTNECVEVFQSQRFRGKMPSEFFDVTEEERPFLIQMIEDLAGRNTLIVNRLGAMARDYGWSIEKLNEKLSEKEFNMRKGIDDEEELQDEINKLYSVEYIENASERSILEAFSLFPTVPLTRETCVNWLREDAKVDEDDCSLLISKLAKHTWLDSHAAEGSITYSMHQMVMMAIKAQVDVIYANHVGLIRQCYRAITPKYGQPPSPRYYVDSSKYMPFVFALGEHFYNDCSLELMLIFSTIGWRWHETDSDKWHERALVCCAELSAMESAEAIAVYHNIAKTYASSDNYEEAMEWYQKALDVCEISLVPNDLSNVNVYKGMALVLTRQKEYGKALKINERVLCLQKENGHSVCYCVAATYRRMGNLSYAEGEYSKAMAYYKEELAIYERISPKEHQEIADICETIGKTHEKLGEHLDAITEYAKAFEINEEVRGISDVRTQRVAERMVLLCENMEDSAKAREWLVYLVGEFEDIFVLEKKFLCSIYVNAAITYFKLHDSQEARAIASKALRIYDTNLGEHNSIEKLYGFLLVYLSAALDDRSSIETIREKFRLLDEFPDETSEGSQLSLHDFIITVTTALLGDDLPISDASPTILGLHNSILKTGIEHMKISTMPFYVESELYERNLLFCEL